MKIKKGDTVEVISGKDSGKQGRVLVVDRSRQRLVIEGARLLKEALLQQSAFDDVDMYAQPERQLWMLKIILHFHERAGDIIKKGAPIYRIREMEAIEDINRMKARISNDKIEKFTELLQNIDEEFDELEQDYAGGFF